MFSLQLLRLNPGPHRNSGRALPLSYDTTPLCFCLSVSGSHRPSTGLRFSMKPGVTLRFWPFFLYLESTGTSRVYTPMLTYYTFLLLASFPHWVAALPCFSVQSLKQYLVLLRHPNSFVWWTKVDFSLNEITLFRDSVTPTCLGIDAISITVWSEHLF